MRRMLFLLLSWGVTLCWANAAPSVVTSPVDPDTVFPVADVVVAGEQVLSLDLYETTEIRKFKTILGGAPQETYRSKLSRIIERLKKLDAKRGQAYSDRLGPLLDKDLSFVPAVFTGSPARWRKLVIPAKARVEKLTDRKKLVFYGDRPLLVRQDLWDRMSEDDRAVALLHELVAEEILMAGEDPSDKIRYLVSWMISEDLEKLDARAYYDLWKSLSLVGSVVVNLQDIPFDSSSVVFHENRKIRSGRIDGSPTLMLFNRPAQLEGGSVVVFYDTGVLRLLSVTSVALELAGVSYRFKGQMRFHPSGALAQAFVAEARQVEIAAQSPVVIPELSQVDFYESGRIEGIRAPSDYNEEFSVRMAGGRAVSFRYGQFNQRVPLEFHPNGQLKRGVLARNTELPVGERSLRFSNVTPVEFFEDGRVRRGQLTANLIDLPQNGVQKEFRSLPILVFDHEGNVVREE